MRANKQLLFGLIIILLAGCSNRDAAQLGGLIGRSLGKPLGTLATAVDETFQTTGDVVKENPRYQRSEQKISPQLNDLSRADNSHYYKTEVLVKTSGPAQIESLELQRTEDVSEFWR